MRWALFFLVLAVFGAYLFWLLCRDAPDMDFDEPTDIDDDQLGVVGTESFQQQVDRERVRRADRWGDAK